MNSEEIKEIGQMFLMISKQNNQSSSLSDDEKTRLNNTFGEIKKNIHELEVRFQPLEKKSNGESNDNTWLRDKVKELSAKVDGLATKIGELGYKVGGYGGLISSLQKKEGERTEELNKIRKDYRELQEEMWERFNLIEEWILADTSRDKQKFRDEIIDIRTDHEKQKNYTMLKADQKVTPKTWAGVEIKIPPKSETSQSIAWAKIPISKLELSVRSHNALITGGYHYVGNIITQSPHDLIQIRNFGRKCLREVMKALEEKNLTLNMQKFKEQRKERYAKENTQRGNLYGIKQ